MLLEPKLLAVIREGYGRDSLRHDAIAGLTVAIVGLPLAMARAIASGTTPEKGLQTAIVAGFLISALGGSRVQIGGPTAAFIPVVASVVAQFGVEGLVLCTLLAGLLLVAAGILRVGVLVRRMPMPVIVGFSAGIALSIVASQARDLLGLPPGGGEHDFLARCRGLLLHLGQARAGTLALSALALVLILGLRRWRPTWPGFLIAALACTLLALALPGIDTLASRFGELPRALPQVRVPRIPFERTLELLPASLTIAFLAGVESLLSAVVADKLTGRQHRASAELVAQGIANVGSALIGGLPATGAIARTATNVRAGARSPVAGMLHAVFLALFLWLFAPWLGYVPLAALAAILLVVAWNISEHHAFRLALGGPWQDAVVMLATFSLTLAFDLTVGILAGIGLSLALAWLTPWRPARVTPA
jgi:SulP family sulfate permease